MPLPALQHWLHIWTAILVATAFAPQFYIHQRRIDTPPLLPARCNSLMLMLNLVVPILVDCPVSLVENSYDRLVLDCCTRQR